jgi:hypothetical protein
MLASKLKLNCVICGEFIPLGESKTDGNGGAVHEECIAAKLTKLPEYINVNPVTLTCPRCNAKPGEDCDVLLNNGLELVHIERIQWAGAMDVTAGNRLARERIPSKLSK